ncbi:MAG: hypothetical protein GF421_06970 [Candidatus Aminicenantes bacterium]|nr:hypothetical protein [Candidatus Aminicenantes bacterium]
MKKKSKIIILITLIFLLFSHLLDTAHANIQPVPLSQYLNYAQEAADWTWDHYDQRVQKWRENFDPENVFGYRPPGGLLEMAVIYAYLFKTENIHKYGERAKKVINTYDEFTEVYPQWAVKKRPDYDIKPPVLPDFFTAMRYIRAYALLKDLGLFSQKEKQEIETHIAESMQYLLRSQEWGTMNRAALRAESLAWAEKTLPLHPDAEKWHMQRKALGDDNWGNWEIEDATIYNAVWLYALCGYSYALDKMEELFKTPEMYYYANYYLHLMCPAGMIPDFGDAHWMRNWNRFLVFFETAANQYQNNQLKWAASVIAHQFIDFDNPTNIGLGYMLLDCYLWGSNDVNPVPPKSLSKEVMEDVVGKKIVFRNGWQPHSTYMLLNYRDEGSGGANFRDYLRDTIPVEEEKMTHGHSDENSIVLLMYKGSVLLHDGGYRDYMPSGPFGAYRQDYFHNRLCVRPEKIFMGQKKGQNRYSTRDAVVSQPVLDFLRNAGTYRKVRTKKIDFLTFDDFDYSRTRLIDDKMGYEWDRILVCIKDPEMFVVFDVFKSTERGYFTLSNLWHTRKITSCGNHWYDTVYDRINNHTFPEDQHLLILFPLTHYRMEGVVPQKRHYQEELFIHQTTAQHFELAETVGFVTLLIPHSSQINPEVFLDRVTPLAVAPQKAGMGIKISDHNRVIYTGVKNNLRMDISRDWRRPRYTYEAGKIRWGPLESNGDFVFAVRQKNSLNYTIINLTKALYSDQLLIEVKSDRSGLPFDGSEDKAGKLKLRYWRDSAVIEKKSP